MTTSILRKKLTQSNIENAIDYVTRIAKENGFGVLYTINFGEISREKKQKDMGEYIQL